MRLSAKPSGFRRLVLLHPLSPIFGEGVFVSGVWGLGRVTQFAVPQQYGGSRGPVEETIDKGHFQQLACHHLLPQLYGGTIHLRLQGLTWAGRGGHR